LPFYFCLALIAQNQRRHIDSAAGRAQYENIAALFIHLLVFLDILSSDQFVCKKNERPFLNIEKNYRNFDFGKFF